MRQSVFRPELTTRLSTTDPNSFSNPEFVRVEKFKIRWMVDFERKVLSGSATYDIIRLDESVDHIIFDTNRLNIRSIHWPPDGRRLEYILGNDTQPFGCPLTIILPEIELGKNISILIDYETSPNANGLQWISPDQTQGKKFPLLFSYAKPINARSFFPCQDTPSVKATYVAEITAPKYLTVLMSGLKTNDPELINGHERRHKFCQNIPIPSYLVAIAIGRLAHGQIGAMTTLWAEDDYLDESAFDFSDTDKIIKITETFIGTKYEWGIYDLLVLPKYIPFDGMGNPCLTYINPTILTGDKSLAMIVGAFEIANCWTRNLITITTFEHIWLNDGCATYLQRLILGKMKGEQYRQFLNIEGWRILKECVNRVGNESPFTSLIMDLTGINPENLLREISCEKGCIFLNFLENKIGRDSFEIFFFEYIRTNLNKLIDSEGFKSQFNEYINLNKKTTIISEIEWNQWLHGKGIPPNYEPQYDQTFLNVCNELIEKWKIWDPSVIPECPFNKDDFNIFYMKEEQMKGFLLELLEIENESSSSWLDIDKIKAIETAYEFNQINNCDIKYLWIRLCIKFKWIEQVTLALDFLTGQSRLKLIEPIYRDLYSWEDVRFKVIETFNKHKSTGMMSVAVRSVMKDLHLDKNVSFMVPKL